MMYRLFLILSLNVILFFSFDVKSQSLRDTLFHCNRIITNGQISLFDEVNVFLNNVNKDSIENKFDLFILYHTCKFKLNVKECDWQESINEINYILPKISSIKHLQEFQEPYKTILYWLGTSYLQLEELDNAILYYNKLLVEGLEDNDMIYFYTYQALNIIYDKLGNTILSNNSQDKCQEFLVRRYIKENPEHSYYFDNYKSLKKIISYLEYKNKTNTEEYINTLCSLGYLLYNIAGGEYRESMLVLSNAHKFAIDNDLKKSRGLDECYYCLQEIYIKYVREPRKLKSLIPYMIEYYSGVFSPEDIYLSISAAYGASQQYEKSIEYNLKILDMIEKNEVSNIKTIKKTYKKLVQDYVLLRTDSTNNIAFQYLNRLGEIISTEDEYYEWYIDNYGCLLRYLYREDAAIEHFLTNLIFYKNKYGKHSNQYISTLNQLALCYKYSDRRYFSYLNQAKVLIKKLFKVDKNGDILAPVLEMNQNSDHISWSTTIRGISVNLAHYYIYIGEIEKAMVELEIAKSIDCDIYGEVSFLTQELINKCIQR